MRRSLLDGISRREFLEYCAALGALIGASRGDVFAALEDLAQRPRVLWSQFQECTGCSVNLLQSRKPDPAQLLLQQISLDYHETIMAAAGERAEEVFDRVVETGDFYYIVEGAIATGIPEAITIRGRTSMDIVKSAYQKAKATICIGSCACYGNIQAAYPNPTGAKGVRDFLRHEGGIPDAVVVNSPRCPGNAEDTIAILVYVLVHGQPPPLDPIGRPLFLFGELIHDNCERRGHFDAGRFVEQFGDEASEKRWCLYKMGCKGPVTHAPCPITRWNGCVSWPVEAGPCIGCAEPGFWDRLTPFYKQAPGFGVPVKVSASTIGYALGGVTAAAIGAHYFGSLLMGRLAAGPTEESPSEGEPPQEEG